MAKLKTIKESKRNEAKGVWVEYELGIAFKIAKMGNPKFHAKVRELSAPYIAEIRDGKMPAEKLDEIQREAVAECILVGWRNIEGDDGKALRYSVKRAKEIFADEDLQDIYDFVLTEASKQTNYAIAVGEDSAKN